MLQMAAKLQKRLQSLVLYTKNLLKNYLEMSFEETVV